MQKQNECGRLAPRQDDVGPELLTSPPGLFVGKTGIAGNSQIRKQFIRRPGVSIGQRFAKRDFSPRLQKSVSVLTKFHVLPRSDECR